MPESLIIKLPKPAEGELTSFHDAEILLEMDGTRHKLTRVKRACIVVDGDEPLIQVDLTMYSPQFDDEITITRANAEAIRNHQTDQGLSFLTTDDRKRLRAIRADLANPPISGSVAPADADLVVLDKLIAEFDRHESELADIPF